MFLKIEHSIHTNIALSCLSQEKMWPEGRYLEVQPAFSVESLKSISVDPDELKQLDGDAADLLYFTTKWCSGKWDICAAATD